MNKWRTCPESLSISNTTWISSGGTTSTALCSALVDRDSLSLPPTTKCKGSLEAPNLSPYSSATSCWTRHWTLRVESPILGLWLLTEWQKDRRIGWPPFIPRSSTMASLPATCLPWLLTCGSLVPKDNPWLPSFPRLVPPPVYQFWEHLTPLQ